MDLFGRKAKRHAKRLADALENVIDDMLGATDFGYKISDPDHPFHESVKEGRAAIKEFEGR
jgi:hypothetical protein